MTEVFVPVYTHLDILHIQSLEKEYIGCHTSSGYVHILGQWFSNGGLSDLYKIYKKLASFEQ